MKDGQWALIAGSAEGLGAAFTERLAAQGFNLILADRLGGPLKKTAEEAEQKFRISTLRLEIDLGEAGACETCMNAARGVDCRMLVYNAAMSEVKPFLDHSSQNLERFIDVNDRTSMLLVREFALHLRAQGKPGRILLMASMAGLLSPVYVAPYAATKAFLISISRSLFYEFRPHGIGISVCCPGIMNTPRFLESSAQGQFVTDDPQKVARYAVKHCGKKAVLIPGWMNRLNYIVVSRILPPALSSYFVNRAMRKMYPRFSE